MNDEIEQIASLRARGLELIAAAGDSGELERVRVELLGRRAPLPMLLRGVAQLPAERRSEVGRAANQARRELEAAIQQRAEQLGANELQRRLAGDRVDVTLPGDPPPTRGSHHLISAMMRAIEDVFLGLGYRIAEGPEVELARYNFDALNTPLTHPSRLMTDTFYLAPAQDIFDPEALLLRVHTSPVQIRAMESTPPPIQVIAPGRVYRPDSDATHSPQFHQIEGLAVGEDITLADLQGTLLTFARAIFGAQRQVRMRPHHFPFTEPSVEVDVSCFHCHDGLAADGQRCPLCKGTAWIEILGAGMVDPAVLDAVAAHGYDSERHQGFAFGMGVERIAMLKHGVPDLRLLYDNDIRFLEQFS